MDTDLIFCAGLVIIFALFFSFLLLWRYIKYKETKMLAEKGILMSRKPQPQNNGSWTLPIGIIFSALGLAIFLGMLPLSSTPMASEFSLGLGPWLLFGIIPLFFGLSLILVYYIKKKEKREDPIDEDNENSEDTDSEIQE